MKKIVRTLLAATLIAVSLAGIERPASARRQQTPAAKDTSAQANQTASRTDAKSVASRGPQEIVREGIKVEFTISPAAGVEADAGLMAGQDAVVRFHISDTATGTPLGGARPAAWLSLRESGDAADAARCREKIQGFMQGSLRARPEVDLNSYYILALNNEPNISVIDPLIGFGGSKLVTLVLLKSPGEDWELTQDRARLFVSMPAAGQVAVVNTETWKTVANLDAGARPSRVRLQPDGKYLWVSDDAEGKEGGVIVFDAVTLKTAGRLRAGAGRHDIAFTPDSKFAFVSNHDDGTVTVIDVARLEKIKDVKTGAEAGSLAFSTLSGSLYVTDGRTGEIVAVDGRSHEVAARIKLKPGVGAMRFAPGGRYGFVPGAATEALYVFDASTNRLVHDLSIAKGPDQVSFTAAFAYVRARGSEDVTLVRLSTIGRELDVQKFPGGQLAPEAGGAADSFAPTPEGNAMLVANAGDRQIYYYTEGMAAPMGTFQNYKRVPRAVRVVDRSLREGPTGVYAAGVRLPRSGRYDVAFLLDSPRIVHCFNLEAAANPALDAGRKVALSIEYLDRDKPFRVGEPYKLRFKLTDAATGRPKDGLKDVRVISFLSPGLWQQRDIAQPSGEGVYEMTMTPPEQGVYFFFVESQSQGVAFRQLPHLTLQAAAAPAAPAR